jgi:hypothetical protein
MEVTEMLREEKEIRETGRTVAGIVNSNRDAGRRWVSGAQAVPDGIILGVQPVPAVGRDGADERRPGEAKGAPDHPHRGFETVTYILSGEMEHKDSQGHTGKLSAGDVQWMTAVNNASSIPL